ncbi:MAG: UMP kinase [Patescibacteria group bacterium]
MYKYKILSVGGSIIIPKTGFDIEFLKNFRTLILDQVKQGHRFVLTIGGGATCRQYQQAVSQVVPMTNEDLDWLGIYSTHFNAQFVRFLFKDAAHHEVITNPTKKIRTKKPVIIAAGWKPGASTDIDAVLLAKNFKAKEVFNLSNIDQVYTADPVVFADAKPIESIDWKTFRRDIVGDAWEPGKNVPFDPIASKLAEKLKLTVSILKGTDLDRLEKALNGEKFLGTLVVPSPSRGGLGRGYSK